LTTIPRANADDPDAVAPVRRTNGRSWDNVPLRVIPERGQRPENFTHTSSKQRCDVLHDNVSGSKLANDPSELVPKTGPCAGEPGPFSGVADVLAGEAAADEIDFPVAFFRGERADIGVSPDIGPVLGEDFLGIRVNLHLPCTLHPGPLKAEIKTTDAAEEGAELHSPLPRHRRLE